MPKLHTFIKRKIVKTENITLDVSTTIKELELEGTYKYLGHQGIYMSLRKLKEYHMQLIRKKSKKNAIVESELYFK